MTTAVAAPFRFFALQVARTRRLGPSLVRVTFTGPELRDFRSDGRDQSLSLFLPQPGQSEPVVPLEQGWGSPRSSEAESGGGWWQGWRELPDDVRAVMRSYTLRELRTDAGGPHHRGRHRLRAARHHRAGRVRRGGPGLPLGRPRRRR
ncbi:siderophore-interacting protein [Streptomyces sp. NPDC088106]|uniref:siderophore-interacting protein n=1 Tax=Streptomyces sp. NPDC088106 TaxID=3154867 RepID=UPI00341614AA